MVHKIIDLLKLDSHDPVKLVGIGTAVAATGFFTVYYGYHKLILFKERKRLGKLRKQKQEERQEVFKNVKSQYEFSQKRQSVVETPVDELIEKLQSRLLSAKEVLEAFIAKSIHVTETLNCITEYIPQAMEWAEKLDTLSTVKGPLHGLPFCVKDDYDIKGMDTTSGLSKYLYNPAQDSAALVKVLRDLGGVPFCKTNVPQTIFSIGSENPVYGVTLNANFPERKLAPGGSSAGTGSLVGAGGAVFGLGSDLGGSGRIPAHCNGISSLKPTLGRLCKKGFAKILLPGCVGLSCVPSVFAATPKCVTAVFKSIVDGDLQRKYDGTVVPVHWNVKMHTSRDSLRIGFYTSLHMFPSFGSTQKTLLNAKAALEARGHTLVPFDLLDDNKLQWHKVFGDLLCADRGVHLQELLYGEPVSRATRHFYWNVHTPWWIRHLMSSLLGWIPISSCQNWAQHLKIGFDADTTKNLWKFVEIQNSIVDQVLSSIENLQLDAIICPVFPFPALGVEDFHKAELFAAAGYTCFWNLVDHPVGVVRFGTEKCEDIDKYDDRGNRTFKFAKKAILGSMGMPIGVQVVGKKFEEEMVLRLLNELGDSYEIEQKTS